MKIENNGIQPLPTERSEATRRVDGKNASKDVHAVHGKQDKAEMSENARLLAKARVALGNVEDHNAERLEVLRSLRSQVESGDYTVQVSELARKLAAKLFPQ